MKGPTINEVSKADLLAMRQEYLQSTKRFCIACGLQITKGLVSEFCSAKCRTFYTANATAIYRGILQREHEELKRVQQELLQELHDKQHYIEQLETSLKLLLNKE